MARSMNRVTLCGNLGTEPEINTLASGSKVAKVTIATSEAYKDKTTGEWKETTDWHRLTFWDNLADTVGNYLHKGSKILVEGRLRYGEYTGNDGIKRHTTEIIVKDLVMLDKREDGDKVPHSQFNPQPFVSSVGSTIADQLAGALTPDVEDDDIPF